MRDRGFSTIELLIVMVIIGTLAAIVIPNFTNTKTRSFDGAAKSDLRNMIAAQENYFSDNQAYSAAAVSAGGQADLDGDGTEDFRASRRVTLSVTPYTDGFLLTSAHAGSPNTWCMNTSSSNASGPPGTILQQTSC